MSRLDTDYRLIHGIGSSSHFNYTLFPKEDKSKPACGIKKNEVYDYIISKEREYVIKHSHNTVISGCNSKSYELYTDNFNIKSNNDCNKAIKKEIIELHTEIKAKRQKLNDIMESYPYASIWNISCARFNKLLRWSGLYGTTYIEFFASILLFIWIVFLIGLLEIIICYPFYCIIHSKYSKPTAIQVEEWFDTNISSNSNEFDAEKVDSFIIERLQEICNKLNDKFSQSGISLKPVTYLDEIEVASYDIPDGEGGNTRINNHNVYYDEFLILNDNNKLNDAI